MENTEKQEVIKKRDIALNRMKSKYPEENFEDEEVLFGKINDDYDDYDKQIADRNAELEEYKGREKSFSEMFSADPRSAAVFNKWREGEDPEIAFLRLFGPDIVEVINDPEKQEQVAEANKEYAKSVLKAEEYEKEYNDNINEALTYMKSLEEGGKNQEEVDQAFGILVGIAYDALKGKFTPESFDLAFKALSHDADVKMASEDGEVKGRNAKIDEKLRKAKQGDGTQPIGGKNVASGNSLPKPQLGALDRYGEGASTIWDRGNEKRTKY